MAASYPAMSVPPVDPIVTAGPRRAGSVATILLCGLAMIVEGFDTYAIGFVGPAISREWGLSQSVVGQLYAVGVAAALIGSILFGALADRFGRKGLLIFAMALFGVATLFGALSGSLPALMLSRIAAGIGMGASIPCAMALAAEVAPERYRGSVPVLMSAAIGAGVIVAGLAAAALMPRFGWQGLLFLGAAMPLLIAVAMPRLLLDSRPAATAPGARAPWRMLLSRDLLLLSLTVSAGLFATYVVTFFFGFWMPALIQQVAPDIRTVGLAMAVIKTCSLVGALTIAFLIVRFGMARVLPAAFVVAAVALATLIGNSTSLVEATVSLAIASFFIDGAFSGIVGLGVIVFPSRVRATAIGITLGISRLLGGTAGPMLGGILLDRHLSLHAIAIAFSLPLLIAAVLVLLATRLARRNSIS